MPKKATKAASNIFYQARMKAASYNDKLASREGASEVTGIDRNRIAYTELGTMCPYPEEILAYAEFYNAPELLNYYCSNLCPIGRETVDSLNVGSFEHASLKLLSSTRCISSIRDEILDISEDGVVSEEEKAQMKEILIRLKQTADEAELAFEEILIMEDAANSVAITDSNFKANGVSTSKDWVITEIDFSVVPTTVAGVQIRPVDVAAVMKLIRSSKGQISIPGITYKEVPKISFRK